MADDNTLRVAAEFDVAPLIAGTQQAGAAFDSLNAKLNQVATVAEAAGNTTIAQAARFMASGLSAKEAASALQNFGVSAKEAAEAAEAAAVAVGVMGNEAVAAVPKIEAATIATTGMDRQMAAITGRAAGATVGMGFLGGAIGRLAAMVPGLGLAFEIALPIALLAAFLPKIEELIHKSEDVADAEHAVTEAAQKQNDEILKLNEEYTKLTAGPMAAYEQELKDIPLLSLDLTNQTKLLIKELEEEASWWTIVRAKMQDFFLASADASIVAYSSDDAEKAIRLINDSIKQNKDLAGGIHGIELEITKAIQAQNVEMQQGRYLDAQRTQEALRTLEADKELLIQRQEINKDEARNKSADVAKEQLELTLKKLAADEKDQEALAKVAAINAEELANQKLTAAQELPQATTGDVEGRRTAINAALEAEKQAKLDALSAILTAQQNETEQELVLYAKQPEKYEEAMRKERADANTNAEAVANVFKEMNEKINENNRAAATKTTEILKEQAAAAKRLALQQVEDQISEVEEGVRTSESAEARITENIRNQFEERHITGLRYVEEIKAAAEQEYAVVHQMIEREMTDIALKARVGIISEEEETRKLLALYKIQEQAYLKMLADEEKAEEQATKKMETDAQRYFKQITSELNSSLNQWIEGHKKLGQALAEFWDQLVIKAIDSILRIGEEWLVGLLLQQSAQEKQVLMDAKTAAANAYASAPNPIIGAVEAAATFAAVVAAYSPTFAQGGIVPGSSSAAIPIIAHGQEMVLPGHISNALQKAIPSIAGSGGGGSRVTHNHISIVHQGTNLTHGDIIRAVRIGVRKGELGSELA